MILRAGAQAENKAVKNKQILQTYFYAFMNITPSPLLAFDRICVYNVITEMFAKVVSS